jgi:hypothetical protein
MERDGALGNEVVTEAAQHVLQTENESGIRKRARQNVLQIAFARHHQPGAALLADEWTLSSDPGIRDTRADAEIDVGEVAIARSAQDAGGTVGKSRWKGRLVQFHAVDRIAIEGSCYRSGLGPESYGTAGAAARGRHKNRCGCNPRRAGKSARRNHY